ncbi:amidohydrolase [Neotamlana laminarinivorans]|uniref:Omega-amidase YafV n=1 Tax=Neotamlana laminarinivorans TaxID=2883124 RepID=A0A9X1I1X7_9FLAO|nr:amidohydrolase [Tamlana laminarinivorans]MCB4798489.1 amidohydrolase [Tamlana laminarinivorans]
MQKHLEIALIQLDLIWENSEKNRNQITSYIKNLPENVDLVVLPEMFTTGFSMNAKNIAETMQGKTVSWMQQLAIKQNIAITGSIVITENTNFYNRLIFAEPNGNLKLYNKRHTFTFANEDKTYTAGHEKLIINYKGWKICPLICYDLRFPVWARNIEDYDVLIYVANWPKPRINAWDTLLKARAIENMSYCIGVNRVGNDALNNEYCGHSAVYNVLGNSVATFNPNEAGAKTVTLSKSHLKNYRNKFKFLNDKDLFTIQEK